MRSIGHESEDLATFTNAPTCPPLMSLRAAFPVSHSVLHRTDADAAQTMLAGSGRRCAELYMNPSRLGCLVRMLLVSTDLDLSRWLLKWRPMGTKSHRRLAFQLVPLDEITGGCASGFSHTPTRAANQGAKSMQKHKCCRGLTMTPQALEERMGYPANWTELA